MRFLCVFLNGVGDWFFLVWAEYLHFLSHVCFLYVIIHALQKILKGKNSTENLWPCCVNISLPLSFSATQSGHLTWTLVTRRKTELMV